MINENPTSWRLFFHTAQMCETFRQVVPIDFHETYDFKDLYGFQLENFARSEVTNVLVRTEIFICAWEILESNSHWPLKEVEH